MINRIKKAIQDKLYQDCIEEYRNGTALSDRSVSYVDSGDRAYGSKDEESYPSLSVVYFEQCGEDFSLDDLKKDIILFCIW